MTGRVFLLSLIALLLSCQTTAPVRSEKPIAREISSVPLTVEQVGGPLHYYAQMKEAQDPVFEDLVELVKSPRVSTMAEFLYFLKKGFPKYMMGYSLVYDSLSHQDGSYAHPRAIVFGGTARTIITFNGCEVSTEGVKQRGCGSLKTMQFHPDEGFLFREIQFKQETEEEELLKEEDLDEELSNERVLVSKPNIQKCAECHGDTRPRPIWDSAFLWPGVYGGHNDDTFGNVKRPESEHYAKLAERLDIVKLNDRYAKLGTLAKIGSQCRQVFSRKPVCPNPTEHPKPNSYLTYLLSSLVFQDVIRRDLTDLERARDVVSLVECKKSSAQRQLNRRVIEANQKAIQRQLFAIGLAKLQRQERFDEVLPHVISHTAFPENHPVLEEWVKEMQAQWPDVPVHLLRSVAVLEGTNTWQLAKLETYLNHHGLSLADWSMSMDRSPTFKNGQDNLFALVRELKLKYGRAVESDCNDKENPNEIN